MERKTAVVIGATGLTGAQVVEALLADDYFDKVRILVRRPVHLQHAKLEVQLTDFTNLHELESKPGKGDILFCCIGTTAKKVRGDKQEYRRIDYDIPITIARLAVQQGYEQFLLMSAAGANAAAANFYLQLKGSVEEDLAAMPFPGVHIFRPSVLLGQRKERRWGEGIAKVLMSLLSFLFIGSLRKYKPIQSSKVAKAMVAVAKKNIHGVYAYQYDDIRKLAG